MKLILREYLLALKEDGELDTFIANLLRELDLIPLTTPQKGRQYGVDISAVGPDFEMENSPETIFLFAIKRGNITRSSWDADRTGVRNTLNEIKDVYISTSLSNYLANHPIKIIVATNGEIDQSVNINWVSFINQNKSTKISYDFWGIDKLVNLAEKTQFSELLFPPEIQSLLRKSLALLDLPEYDYSHFYELINKILLKETPSKKEVIKTIRLLNTCLAIVLYWSESLNNIKPAIIISERLLLNVWHWMLKVSSIYDKDVVIEYISMVHQKNLIDTKYFFKLKDCFFVEDGLIYGAHFEHIEYCLITYEQIGIISTIGLRKLWEAEIALLGGDETFDISPLRFQEAEIVAESLVQLIENNPSSCYPKFDEHNIEINMALLFLFQTDRYQDAVKWLAKLIDYLESNFIINNFFPLFVSNYEKLAEIEIDKKIVDVDSSILLIVLVEWSLILDQEKLYQKLKSFIDTRLPTTDLQLWFPEKNTEEFYYTENAMHDSGKTKVSIQLPKNHINYMMEISEERVLFNEEYEMSFLNYGYEFLGYIASRHFRTYIFPNSWRVLLNSPFCFNKIEKAE